MSDPNAEEWIAGGMQAVKDVGAALPFRRLPTYEDVSAAIEAVLRYIAYNKPREEAATEPPAEPPPSAPEEE